MAKSVPDSPKDTLLRPTRSRHTLHDHQGIENWFLNGDNNPESIEAVEQIGSKSSKDTYRKSGRQGKSASTDAGVKTRSTLQANSGQQHLLSSSGRMARSSERSVRSSMHPRKQPRQLQCTCSTSGETTRGNGIRTRPAHVSSRSAGPRRPTGRTTTITNL
jgi:hypothetical protein